MNLYLRDQATILADVKARLRNATNARWPNAEIYGAVNDALTTWHGRVSVPVIYTIPGGYSNGQSEYILPSYIDARTIVPQMRRTVPWVTWGQLDVNDTQVWVDVPGWTVAPNEDGDWVLHFDVPPYSVEGRILWYMANGSVPATPPTTSGSTDAAATSVVLGSVVDCWDSGFVRAGNEWIQYAGVTRASTTTLVNCLRGLDYGVAAATISSGTTINWGVVMPRLGLYRVLIDQVALYLHELYLTDAATKETQIHQQMVGFYQARIDKFWKNWIPLRRPRVILDRRFATVE